MKTANALFWMLISLASLLFLVEGSIGGSTGFNPSGASTSAYGRPGYENNNYYDQQQQQQQQQQQRYQQQQQPPEAARWQPQRTDGNYRRQYPAETTAFAPHQADERVLPLPPGWSEHYDPASGKPYYYNAKEGITTWDRPRPFVSTPPEENNNEQNCQQQQPQEYEQDEKDMSPVDPSNEQTNIQDLDNSTEETGRDTRPSFEEEGEKDSGGIVKGIQDFLGGDSTDEPEDVRNHDPSVAMTDNENDRNSLNEYLRSDENLRQENQWQPSQDWDQPPTDRETSPRNYQSSPPGWGVVPKAHNPNEASKSEQPQQPSWGMSRGNQQQAAGSPLPKEVLNAHLGNQQSRLHQDTTRLDQGNVENTVAPQKARQGEPPYAGSQQQQQQPKWGMPPLSDTSYRQGAERRDEDGVHDKNMDATLPPQSIDERGSQQNFADSRGFQPPLSRAPPQGQLPRQQGPIQQFNDPRQRQNPLRPYNPSNPMAPPLNRNPQETGQMNLNSPGPRPDQVKEGRLITPPYGQHRQNIQSRQYDLQNQQQPPGVASPYGQPGQDPRQRQFQQQRPGGPPFPGQQKPDPRQQIVSYNSQANDPNRPYRGAVYGPGESRGQYGPYGSPYGQYGQYAPQQGNYGRFHGPGQQGPKQPVESGPTGAVREVFGSAWRGLWGLGNKTMEAVDTAKTTVVSGAQGASQKISETSTSWWGRAKNSLGSVFESGNEQEPQYSLTGGPGPNTPSGGLSQQQGYSQGFPQHLQAQQHAIPQRPPHTGQYPPGYVPPHARVDPSYPQNVQDTRRGQPPLQSQWSSGASRVPPSQDNDPSRRGQYPPGRSDLPPGMHQYPPYRQQNIPPGQYPLQPGQFGQQNVPIQSQQRPNPQAQRGQKDDSRDPWLHPALNNDGF